MQERAGRTLTRPEGEPFAAVREPLFADEAGRINLGGMPLERIAARLGGTPFYAYGRDAIGTRIAELRAALPPQARLSFAVKANPFVPLLHFLAPRIDGLDVASTHEMELALNTGMEPRSITFAGPGKRPEEIHRALAAGVTLVIESRREAELVTTLAAPEYGAPRLLVRINPSFDLRAGGLRMGGGARPFGIDSDRLPDVIQVLRDAGIACRGFHLFAGSQILSEEALLKLHAAIAAEFVEAAWMLPSPPEEFVAGSGFGIPYFAGEKRLNLARLGPLLAEAYEPLRQAWPAAALTFEMGRYLVGEGGIYCCRVLDVKLSHGKRFIITDGGLHQHITATGNLGGVVKRNFPILLAESGERAGAPEATVVGCLCTPSDILARDVALPEARPGDLLVVLQSGAYGPSASPAEFLHHPPAREVLL